MFPRKGAHRYGNRATVLTSYLPGELLCDTKAFAIVGTEKRNGVKFLNEFERKGEVCVLNSKQKKCIELLVAGDRTQKQIAETLHVTEATICNWKKNEEFISEYTSSLKSSMKDVAAKAFNTEISLLKARSEMVRLMAAKDILDRAGFKPDDNVNLIGSGTVVIVDDCNQ